MEQPFIERSGMAPGTLGNAPESGSENARELRFLGEPNHVRDLASQCPFSVGYDPRTLAGSAIPLKGLHLSSEILMTSVELGFDIFGYVWDIIRHGSRLIGSM